MSFSVILIIAASFFSTWFFCGYLSKPTSIFYVLDDVNERSLHTKPMPRTGGIALVTVILFAWLCSLFLLNVMQGHYLVMAGATLMAIVSFLDDRKSLPRIIRLAIHIIVSFFLVYAITNTSIISTKYSVILEYPLILYLLLVPIVVWCINLYNFMDGIDGLAGGMGVIGFCCMAWFGWYADNEIYFLLASTIAAANLGFLVLNFPPAKLFMGDTGSTVMGYLAAFFSIWGVQATIFPWWCPLLIFSPFILDATATLLRRMYMGERFWEAHKTHYYQKLTQIFGHTKTVIIEYILMLFSAGTSILLYLLNNDFINTILLLVWVVLYFCIGKIVIHLSLKFGV